MKEVLDLSMVPYSTTTTEEGEGEREEEEEDHQIQEDAETKPVEKFQRRFMVEPVKKPTTNKPTVMMSMIKYRECMRNHAASIGGHANDGCGEFMPPLNGVEVGRGGGGESLLKCAACGCHRNFHRKEIQAGGGGGGGGGGKGCVDHHHHPLLFPNLNLTSAPPGPPPVTAAAPIIYNTVGSTPTPTHRWEKKKMGLGFSSLSAALSLQQHFHHHHHLRNGNGGGGGGGVNKNNGNGGIFGAVNLRNIRSNHDEDRRSETPDQERGNNNYKGNHQHHRSANSNNNKRFRTKFSVEQKERMVEFAERIGWKLQKSDDVALNQFCLEVGVKRHVLKVWMHNNKNTLRIKQRLSPPPQHVDGLPHPPPPVPPLVPSQSPPTPPPPPPPPPPPIISV